MAENYSHRGAGLLALLLEWVGETDPEKVQSAVRALLYAGPMVVEFLIWEASKPTTGVTHILRLLDLAERIGGVLRPADRVRLRGLRHHWCPAVGAKAADILKAFRKLFRARGGSRVLELLGAGRRLAAREACEANLRSSSRRRSKPAVSTPVSTQAGG
jgi:hypothetical protein